MALPLLAVILTHRPILIAAVLFVSRLPWLLTAIPAGAYADRADRPRLLRAMDMTRAGLLGSLALLVATGHMTIVVLYVFAFAVGTCDTFFAGSTQAVLPDLVASPLLADANGLLLVGTTTTEQTVGPAVGGLIFSLSRPLPFAADAVSFLGSAALLVGLGGSRPARPGPQERPGLRTAARSLWGDMKIGVVWYRQSAALCLVTFTVAVLAFSQAMVSGILVLFALQRLHLHTVGYGLFMAAVAIGNIVGGLIAARLVRRVGTVAAVVAASVLAAMGYLGAGAVSSPELAAGLLGLEGVAVAVGNVATVSFRQRITPPTMQARVANVWRSIVWGVIPFGALAGGALGATFGLRIPFAVAGGLQLVLAGVVVRPLGRLVGQATDLVGAA